MPQCMQVLSPQEFALLQNPASNLTLLLPPESDLLKLLGGFQTQQLPTADALEILKYHVLPKYLDSMDLVEMDGDTVPTLAGMDAMLMVDVEGDKVTFVANNTVTVVEADIDACSETQVIHKIDKVIIPDGIDADLSTFPPGDPSVLDTALAPSSSSPKDLPPGSAPGPDAAYGTSGIALGTAFAALVAIVAL
jgi:hypothetical protein